MSEVKNLFVEQEEAKRYHQFRPIYHNLMTEKLNDFFKTHIKNTLDVACGTGHSTNALAQISTNIIGCDVSEAMLMEARKYSNIQFIQSPAEKLPFADSTFDYLNISMAYQWLRQDQFLKEAKRVLNAKGFLGIDNYGFSGNMSGHEQFLERYKAFDRQYMQFAPRNKNYPDDSDLKIEGFFLVKELTYQHEVHMNKSQFINYLMTRSNFLELSKENRDHVETLLNDYYESDFNNTEKHLKFHGTVRLYSLD